MDQNADATPAAGEKVMQSNYDYGELRPMHFSLVRELLKAIEETEEEEAGGEFSMVAEALLRDAVREEATDL
ncbi:MAG TPA: hypothetical protein VGB35_11725, partial [Gammaproteobacteria bacterium]